MAIITTKRDLAWSYLSYGISIGTNLLLLPIVLKFLSSSELGLWYSFLSVGGIIVLLDLGFAQTITRNVTYCYSGAKSLVKINMADLSGDGIPNYKLLKILIEVCKLLYFFIALIAAVIILTIGTMYIQHISKELHGSIYIAAWAIYSFGIVLNFYFGYFPCLLMGVGAVAQANKATLIARLFQIIISIVGIFLGFGICALGMGFLVNGVAARIMSHWYLKRFNNIDIEMKKCEYCITLHDVLSTLKILWHNAWRTGISSIGGFLISQSNTIMCSIFLGLSATSTYGLSTQLVTVIGSISQISFNAYMPALTESCINGDIFKTKRILSVSSIMICLIFWIGIIALTTVGMPLINILKPNTVIPIGILLFISISTFLERIQWVFCGYIVATNRIPFVLPNIISGLLIIFLSYMFITKLNMGIWGLVTSNFIVMLAYNYWRWVYLVVKELNISIKQIFVIGVLEIRTQLVQLKEKYFPI